MDVFEQLLSAAAVLLMSGHCALSDGQSNARGNRGQTA
jgi:hypothetical protein